MHTIKSILKTVSAIIYDRLMACHNKLKQCKAFKININKELMPVAWHQTRWWDWCMPEHLTKVIEPIFTNKVE